MPKLSENALEKRFTCQHCGKSIRTRQGLSGHIQFIHNGTKTSSQINVDDIITKMNRYKVLAPAYGIPNSEIRKELRMLTEWLKVETFCKYLGLKLTPQDFKSYILTGMAIMYENEDLYKRLTSHS